MKRKGNFVLQEVAGQPLLVPIGTQVLDMNGLIVLNETGRYLWVLLGEDRTVEALAAALAERFDVEPDRAREDIEAFVNEIDGMGMLER